MRRRLILLVPVLLIACGARPQPETALAPVPLIDPVLDRLAVVPRSAADPAAGSQAVVADCPPLADGVGIRGRANRRSADFGCATAAALAAMIADAEDLERGRASAEGPSAPLAAASTDTARREGGMAPKEARRAAGLGRFLLETAP